VAVELGDELADGWVSERGLPATMGEGVAGIFFRSTLGSSASFGIARPSPASCSADGRTRHWFSAPWRLPIYAGPAISRASSK